MTLDGGWTSGHSASVSTAEAFWRTGMNTLPSRHLGALTVPAIGFGAMVLSPGMYGEIDESGALRALGAALDSGATFVDTSDGYGPGGHNERLVGRAVRG